MSTPVKVFIGSGEASVVERKTLIHSMRKHTERELDIYVFNGTHNAIEHNDEPPVLAPMPLHIKYKNITEFSFYRFLIPQICGFEGRAIWLDSDMVALGDIGELFDAPMNGYDFLATPGSYSEDTWELSVMLIDCARARFDLELYMREIDQGLYPEIMRMNKEFLKHHPFKIGPIDPHWNSLDRHDEKTKLIHYTNLLTQPWKFPGHPYGDLWFCYFYDAKNCGALPEANIHRSMKRAYIRQDVFSGNSPQHQSPTTLRRVARKVRSTIMPR